MGQQTCHSKRQKPLEKHNHQQSQLPHPYEPTYWPTDTNRIPDLLDFFITKNISPRYVQINSSTELSFDHSPVIATVGSALIENPPNGPIHNQLTNWQLFREVFNHSTSASISLETKEDIETATEYSMA